MIHKHLNRRTAILSLGTLLACGTIGYGFWPRTASAREKKSQTVSGYVAPSWLRNLPPYYKKLYGAWDMTFWLAETNAGTNPGGSPGQNSSSGNSMAVLVQSYMSQQGNDGLKRNLSAFLTLSARTAYIEDLVLGLDPTLSSSSTRAVIAGALRSLQARAGSSFFSSAVQNTLLSHYQNEPSGNLVHHHLDLLLTALGVTH